MDELRQVLAAVQVEVDRLEALPAGARGELVGALQALRASLLALLDAAERSGAESVPFPASLAWSLVHLARHHVDLALEAQPPRSETLN